MAHFVPVLSSVVGKMTSGERRFARRLESHLEDDYICWYDVPVGPSHLHPDFLVLHPRRGLLVIEVKDWKLENIQAIDKHAVSLHADGRQLRKANPLEQARQYAFGVCRLLESDPALVGEPGTAFQGKLVCPWGYGVVLANISRKTFSGTDLGNVIPPERVICQDEMAETIEPEAFQKRLWGMFGVTFKCLLTLPQVDRVRWHLFPEIRVSQGAFDLGRSGGADVVPDIVRVMDLRQEQLARSLGDGHRIIHGVAGSGKTMILGYRAQHLAKVLGKPILVLCYNRALAARLQHMVEERGLQAIVSVRGFHGWCNDQLRLYHLPKPEGTGNEFIEKLVRSVIQGVDRGQVPRAQYGAVLVDEGHDFEPEWLKLIAQMVHPDTNSLLVLYDDAQSINRKSRLSFSFAEVGIQARGRTTILRLNYRNTAQIMAVACEFAKDLLTAKEAEEDGIPLVAPQTAGRHGPLPELRRFATEEGELKYVADRARALHEDGTAWRDMAILVRYIRQGERVAKVLEQAKIPFDVALSSTATRFAPQSDTVKIMSMTGSKGLEFPVVFLPCLESMPAPSQEPSSEAKLLYVAMTRAMERLHMTHHAGSVFIDRLRAALKAPMPAARSAG
ncbi:MAG: 3'-5' exonuclease [Pseudomonadota bacterium]